VFLTHLVAAIQVVEPGAGVDAVAMLEAGADAPPDAVLVSVINDLALHPDAGAQLGRFTHH
jgi:LuxR family maltose regulon positive regulatory protein